MEKRLLYYAGYGAGIFYLLGDFIGGIITPDYNFITNAVSELIQSGAEYRIFLSSFMFLHAVMIIVFSIGIIIQYSHKQSKSIFIGGMLLLVVGISHAMSSSLFPMDPIGAESTFPGIMHFILLGISVGSTFIFMPLLGVGLKHSYNWEYFLTFTFLCLAVIIFTGITTPVMLSNGIEVMGLTERIVAYTFYIWMFVLAYLLMNKQSARKFL